VNYIEDGAGGIASAFHEAYERLAPEFGYKTRDASAVPWKDVPPSNQRLMVAVVWDLLDRDIIALATDRDRYREALEQVSEFVVTVTEWVGQPDDQMEVAEAIERVLKGGSW
jgi:hypothetical protein